MSKCIFCSIVEGQIPAYIIYQDDLYLAIMDRYPSAKGHVLILPKRHAADIYELNEAETASLMPLAKKVAEKIRSKLGVPGLNLIQNNGKVAGQVIDHFHLHLIPRDEDDGVVIKGVPQNPTPKDLELMQGLLKI
ncbi:MAG: HIT family protein [Defluviitaleaceae bacterium]|nr:HIT family protein [Defluviitaleaceae bacterium]